MPEYIYTNGTTGPHSSRHEAVGMAAVKARALGQSPREAAERVEAHVAPAEPLRDEPWLTDAHDATEDMQVVLARDGRAVRYDIDDVDWDELNTVVTWLTETDDERRGMTAEEINESPDVVVV